MQCAHLIDKIYVVGVFRMENRRIVNEWCLNSNVFIDTGMKYRYESNEGG